MKIAPKFTSTKKEGNGRYLLTVVYDLGEIKKSVKKLKKQLNELSKTTKKLQELGLDINIDVHIN